MSLPTSALAYPTQAVIDTWNIRERGVRDGTSPTETFEVNNSTAERTFFVTWTKRFDFIDWMLGQSILWNDTGTTRISRLLPQIILQTDMIATKVARLKGHKRTGDLVTSVTGGYAADPTRSFDHPAYQYTSGQEIVYRDAEITIHYDQAPYYRVEDTATYTAGSGGDPDEVASGGEIDRYISPGDFSGSTEYLQLPGGTMKYAVSGGGHPHGVIVPFNIGKVLTQEAFSLTQHRVPELMFSPDGTLYKWIYGDGASILPAAGGVNKTTFYGRPPGTVLFTHTTAVLNRSQRGFGFEWDLQHNFLFDPQQWNRKYYYGIGGSSASNGWYLVSKNGTYAAAGSVAADNSIYNERELNKLFNAAPSGT